MIAITNLKEDFLALKKGKLVCVIEVDSAIADKMWDQKLTAFKGKPTPKQLAEMNVDWYNNMLRVTQEQLNFAAQSNVTAEQAEMRRVNAEKLLTALQTPQITCDIP